LIYTPDAAGANCNGNKSGVTVQYAIPLSKDARPVPQAPVLPARRVTKRMLRAAGSNRMDLPEQPSIREQVLPIARLSGCWVRCWEEFVRGRMLAPP
jgi:hypothetical protein